MGYRPFHRVGESEVVEMAFGRVNVRFVMAVREGQLGLRAFVGGRLKGEVRVGSVRILSIETKPTVVRGWHSRTATVEKGSHATLP